MYKILTTVRTLLTRFSNWRQCVEQIMTSRVDVAHSGIKYPTSERWRPRRRMQVDVAGDASLTVTPRHTRRQFATRLLAATLHLKKQVRSESKCSVKEDNGYSLAEGLQLCISKWQWANTRFYFAIRCKWSSWVVGLSRVDAPWRLLLRSHLASHSAKISLYNFSYLAPL